MDNKISNVIGVPIPQWLIEQFRVRSEKGAGYNQRDVSELQFLANKTAWVRLVSSVEVSGDDNRYFSKYLKDEKLIRYLIEENPKTFSTSVNSLAKNFILFSGTSKYQKSADGKSYSQSLRSGLGEGSYGMLGEEEINRYGYLPMPGITSVTIETMGRMGSVRSATVNFKVFDKLQLDIIDALYFKLGYTMLLEWGHTYYYETPPAQVAFGDFSVSSYLSSYRPQLKSTEDLMIDPFAPNLTKEKVNYQIALNLKKSYGNYDGMLGVVTNFNFSRKEDGSYDCTVKLIGLGAIAESLKINRSNVFTNILEDEVKKIVESENAKRQKQIEEQNAENYARLAQLKQELNTKKSEIEKKLTINELYENKIAEKNKSLSAGEKPFELSNYLYTPSNTVSSLYDKSVADIVYDPDKEWVIRKFGVILRQEKTEISSVTLSPGTFRQLLPNKEDFKKRNPDFSGNNIGGEIFGESFLISTFNGLFRDEYDFYNIPYEKLVDDSLYTTNNSSRGGLQKYKGTLKRHIIIAIKSVNQRNLLDGSFATVPIREALERAKAAAASVVIRESVPTVTDIIREVLRERVYDILTSDISENKLYENQGTVFIDKVELEDLKLKTIKSTDSTNYLNRDVKTRYYPILLLKKDTPNVNFAVFISDSAFISDLKIRGLQDTKEFFNNSQAIQDQANQTRTEEQSILQQIKSIEKSIAKIEISAAQKEEVNKFPSALENALRAIQLYSYNRASNTTSVQKIDFATDKNRLIEAIFKPVGLYSFLDTFESKIINGNIPDIPNYGNVPIEDKNDVELLEFYIKYGFNVSIMANVHNTLVDTNPLNEVKPVNHKDLLCSYVIPYEVSQDLSQGIKLERPVYIQLGTLLMLINHLALMYDSKEDSQDVKRPIFYVDYNPNTNFCLSSLNHLSTNPFNFMIPYSGTKEDFKKLFDTSLLTGEFTDALFDPTEDNIYSQSLPEFLTGAKDKDVYRGKLMNVLIDIDYILNTIKRYSDADNTNSIYFKSFIDNLLSDMCKALGNYNLLRLAYNDAANCFYIVDDQIVPPALGENFASRTTTDAGTYEIPLYGNTSIAKSLEIKTDISSRLSNMIAISANSEKYQSEMANDSTSFGFINSNFRDRYIPLRTDTVSQKQKEENISNITEGDKDAAKKFNDAIIQYYKVIDVTMDSVNSATNYYISRMAKVKAENPASRASAIIPVSVNFTTDGISGFNMYQSFGINEELLPYTYTAKNPVDDQSVQRRVGFCVVGLSHTIEGNQWNTSVKSNMIFLKDYIDYKGDKAQYTRKREEGERRKPVSSISIEDDVKIYTGEVISYSGEIRKTRSYSEFIAIPGVKEKVQEVANYLGVTPSDLYIVIGSETAGTFDSTIVNKISGATGLIQFMPKTAIGLGTTTQQLRNMSPIEQLNYVKKYYAPYRGRTKNVYDLYTVTFFPAALGKPDSYVFQTKNTSAQTISKQNPAIANAAGKSPGTPLTLGDFRVYVSKKIKQFINV